MNQPVPRLLRAAAVLSASAAAIAACSAPPAPTPDAEASPNGTPSAPAAMSAPAAGPPAGGSPAAAPDAAPSGRVPGSAPDGDGDVPVGVAVDPASISHVHAIAQGGPGGAVLLATHEGLARIEDGRLIAWGPPIDLMGFAVAPDGSYLASGHPGAGVDLPEPAGLIRSTDQGRTWTVASRGGESDFHALGAGAGTIAGFDGALRVSADGRSWDTVDIPSPPRSLAVAPEGGALLAATERGLQLSEDGGATWDELAAPEDLVLADWADGRTIVGATAAGRLATSRDAGASWSLHGEELGPVAALSAEVSADGTVETVLVAGGGVVRITGAEGAVEPLL
ncbi:MAG: F510_1955 family glycosylhydrolase [Arthrobacter sp.]|uniref:F510_1955 family glycosylhydrolase n=1 Tax=Arthrobacter sp. TaxID=1667 RepID=UPI003490CF7A